MLTLPMDKQMDEVTRSVVEAAREAHYTPEQLDEVQRLIHTQNTYFWCCDMKYWDIAEDLFADEIACYYNGVKNDIVTPKAEADFLAMHEIPELVPMHMGHNPIVVFTGEKQARVLVKLNSHHTYSDNDDTYQAWGQYVNDYVLCDDGKWRIKVLRLTFGKRIGGFRL